MHQSKKCVTPGLHSISSVRIQCAAKCIDHQDMNDCTALLYDTNTNNCTCGLAPMLLQTSSGSSNVTPLRNTKCSRTSVSGFPGKKVLLEALLYHNIVRFVITCSFCGQSFLSRLKLDLLYDYIIQASCHLLLFSWVKLFEDRLTVSLAGCFKPNNFVSGMYKTCFL